MFLKNARYTVLQYSFVQNTKMSGSPITSISGADLSTYTTLDVSSPVYLKSAMSTVRELTSSSVTSGSVSGGSGVSGVVFGTGSTEPTVNDYKMSGDFILNLSHNNVTSTQSVVVNENYSEITTIYTISNTTNTDMVIGEVGLVYNAYGRPSTSGSYNSYGVLFERSVLESPITIPPGGVGQVTYTIRVNYPM